MTEHRERDLWNQQRGFWTGKASKANRGREIVEQGQILTDDGLSEQLHIIWLPDPQIWS